MILSTYSQIPKSNGTTLKGYALIFISILLFFVIIIILISSLFIFLCMYFPQYGHYCMFLLALNFGFSVLDLLYLKILVFSNYGNYIEEHQSGIHILKKEKFIASI